MKLVILKSKKIAQENSIGIRYCICRPKNAGVTAELAFFKAGAVPAFVHCNIIELNCFINCSLSAVQYLQSSAVSAR